jgi:hypothetical protein
LYIKVLKKDMAKVILEFDPFEDREDMESAINGWKWKMLVWDLDQHLRSELKYNEKVVGEVYEALEKLREQLHGLKNESGLTLD